MTGCTGWKFLIDRGGTFTDVIGLSPEGETIVEKLLSEDPSRYDDAAVEGIRRILKAERGSPIPAEMISSVKMGTTVGTNALLERKGERTALLITQGFSDLLRIGYQNRPDLFSLNILLPEQLYDRVEEIDERILSDGSVERDLDLGEVREKLKKIKEKGIRSLAVVLMNSYVNPAHERRIAEIARDTGFDQISTSEGTIPLIKIVSRGDTTVVDAYLSPVLMKYINRVRKELEGSGHGCDLMFMQSSGGLVDHSLFRGKDCVLSGPAGGVVGAVQTALNAGFERIITFDMGGTSTDVARYGGGLERSYENRIAGVRMMAPMLRIHTVAAGGGSLLEFEEGRFKVGPDSAGAVPGPACYRRGGPLTVTDANLLLGRINEDHFPRVFGEEGNLPISGEPVLKKFCDLSRRISRETGTEMTPEQIAEGYLEVAVENMAQAIKTISTMRGYDVTDHVLACFGGAGGQHACRIADRLGIRKVLIHPMSGVLSALGMGLADIRSIKEKTVEKVFDDRIRDEIQSIIMELTGKVKRELDRQNAFDERTGFVTRLFLKYSGTRSPLQVDFDGIDGSIRNFKREHLDRFSFLLEGKDIIVDSIAVEGVGFSKTINAGMKAADNVGTDDSSVRIWINGELRDAPFYERDRLPPGKVIKGPAMISERTGTNIVEAGWKAEISEGLDLVLERYEERDRELARGCHSDPIRLEIFNRLFISIAEQMGYSLRNTSRSVNIKERLDFSCALFDSRGNLVANAPHIPVHLGSMSESVKRWLKDCGDRIREGDVYLVNSPYHGGTHLPDITVITPVFRKGRIIFFVASRGHHADIGGKTPGSMPPDSSTIFEEGVLSPGMRIVEGGKFREDAIMKWLKSGDHPARDPERNISDIKAQIAANEKGVRETLNMIGRYSLDVVTAYMKHVQDNAEESVRNALTELKDGNAVLETDQGARISVSAGIDRKEGKAVMDFFGTSPSRNDNFNAPSAVCKAAVLFVLRSLVKKDIPLNKGCLEPVEIKIPPGSMLDPEYPAAVAAGNVETSMFIADALLNALGVTGGSQGTMNNLTFGNGRYQYYETICGGTGAGDGFHGTDAVHSLMTNTRITDPEVLEMDHPVVVEEFSIRKGSGGDGRYRGGCGVVRRMRFLEPVNVSILSQHRRIPARGIMGGGDGALGQNTIIRKDGTRKIVGGCVSVMLEEGDSIEIKTPGGGGFGEHGSSSHTD